MVTGSNDPAHVVPVETETGITDAAQLAPAAAVRTGSHAETQHVSAATVLLGKHCCICCICGQDGKRLK